MWEVQARFKGKYFHRVSVRLWNWLSVELVKSLLFQVFKIQQDQVWSELIDDPVFSRGLDLALPMIPCKLNYPAILGWWIRGNVVLPENNLLKATFGKKPSTNNKETLWFFSNKETTVESGNFQRYSKYDTWGKIERINFFSLAMRGLKEDTSGLKYVESIAEIECSSCPLIWQEVIALNCNLKISVMFFKKLLNCKECYTVADCEEIWRISLTANFQGQIEQISVRSWLDRVDSALKQEDQLGNPLRYLF